MVGWALAQRRCFKDLTLPPTSLGLSEGSRESQLRTQSLDPVDKPRDVGIFVKAAPLGLGPTK